jgi:hypothetical protein
VLSDLLSPTSRDRIENSCPLILDHQLATLTPGKEAHQSFLAWSTEEKTVNRQSAGEVMISGSEGEVMGRAVALSLREKNELNVCR